MPTIIEIPYFLLEADSSFPIFEPITILNCILNFGQWHKNFLNLFISHSVNREHTFSRSTTCKYTYQTSDEDTNDDLQMPCL